VQWNGGWTPQRFGVKLDIFIGYFLFGGQEVIGGVEKNGRSPPKIDVIHNLSSAEHLLLFCAFCVE